MHTMDGTDHNSNFCLVFCFEIYLHLKFILILLLQTPHRFPKGVTDKNGRESQCYE